MTTNEWHIFPDERPANWGRFIVTVQVKEGFPVLVEAARYNPIKGRFHLSGWGKEYVIKAWTELPEPYKEKINDK